METPKRTELINAIIQGYSPQQYEYETGYSLQQLTDIANIIWDTAIQDIEKTHDCFVEEINKSIIGLEDLILNKDKQIQSQLSQIESLKQQNEELHEMYSEAISNYKNLQEEHKHELQAQYEKGRDDYADYIDSMPHFDYE